MASEEKGHYVTAGHMSLNSMKCGERRDQSMSVNRSFNWKCMVSTSCMTMCVTLEEKQKLMLGFPQALLHPVRYFKAS